MCSLRNIVVTKATSNNCCITNVGLFQRCYILLMIVEGLLLIIKVRFEQLLNMPIQQLSLVEQTCSLFVNHLNNWIPKTVNNFNNIPFLALINRYFEDKNSLPINLARKITFFDVIIMTLEPQLKNVITCNHYYKTKSCSTTQFHSNPNLVEWD
jgi:hypothetical protein